MTRTVATAVSAGPGAMSCGPSARRLNTTGSTVAGQKPSEQGEPHRNTIRDERRRDDQSFEQGRTALIEGTRRPR